MPVTRDRQARMLARRYTEVEDSLRKNGPALGADPGPDAADREDGSFEPTQRFQTPTQLVESDPDRAGRT